MGPVTADIRDGDVIYWVNQVSRVGDPVPGSKYRVCLVDGTFSLTRLSSSQKGITLSGSTAVPLDASDLFHIGIVVDDPHKAMSELSALLGHEWGEMMGGELPVSLPDGDVVIDLRAWYSLTAPRIEIVQSVPETIWQPTPDSGIHHLGYWADDVVAGSAALEERGFSTEAIGKLPDGKPYWAYHCSATGPRIELVSRALLPTMTRYFETGKLTV